MRTSKRKLGYSLIINACILINVVSIVCVFAESNSYWSIGWNNHLDIIGVKIDTPTKYIFLLCLITCVQISRVIVEEMGMPILNFTIYNPHEKIIKDFTKNELQFFANAMFTISGLRDIFITMLQISQIDVAAFSLLISQLTGSITIYVLLNEKKYISDLEQGTINSNSSINDDTVYEDSSV